VVGGHVVQDCFFVWSISSAGLRRWPLKIAPEVVARVDSLHHPGVPVFQCRIANTQAGANHQNFLNLQIKVENRGQMTLREDTRSYTSSVGTVLVRSKLSSGSGCRLMRKG